MSDMGRHFHLARSPSTFFKSGILFNLVRSAKPKAVTVIMHSEYVRGEDIKIWLSFKCVVMRGLDLKDEDGIRTGAYRFYVHLHRDENSGDLTHLPPIIQLGAIRGYVFYAGQPKTCSKCGGNDHLAAECDNVVCKNCNSDEHIARKCNLCGGEGHNFRACPQSYANRVKRPQLQQLEEIPMLTGGAFFDSDHTSGDNSSQFRGDIISNA
uniref:CCHC-type domain-containing protein n=1 Tax=Haplochromis burtoni TaxID=8153 RepID=A0A3Q2VGS0_HAPBU